MRRWPPGGGAEGIVDSTNIGAIWLRGGAEHGRGAGDAYLQRSALPPGGAGKYGNHLPGPVDPDREEPSQWPDAGLRRLRSLGFRTAAMALSDDSVSIEDPRLLAEERLAIVLGTEGDGLVARTIAACDYTVRIPMAHEVDSLNVAAASAVAFWQLRAR